MASRKGLFRCEIVGARDLERSLRELGTDRLIKATMKRALLDVAKPIAADASARAPRGEETGKPHMADKIAASPTLSRRQRRGKAAAKPTEANVYIGAGPRGPGVLDEFGTDERHHKSGKSTGAAPAQPFLRPAWEAGKHQALADFGDALGIQIEKSARRLARRQAKLLRSGG